MRNLIADPPDKQMVKEMPDGTIEFSKLTPFGVGRYTRKKEDLNEEEKEIWEKYKLSRDSAGQKKNAREQQK